jgi:hypothetical protein
VETPEEVEEQIQENLAIQRAVKRLPNLAAMREVWRSAQGEGEPPLAFTYTDGTLIVNEVALRAQR